MNVSIEKMGVHHWGEVKAIYLAGIENGDATFETTAPDWEEWQEAHNLECNIVAKIENKVVGWAALSNVSDRCVYDGVAENSVYVHPDHQGQRIGSTLMEAMIGLSENQGFWTLQTGIFPENKASLALHQKYGFRIVGRRERIGKMNGIWRDVLFIERRSQKVGIDSPENQPSSV